MDSEMESSSTGKLKPSDTVIDISASIKKEDSSLEKKQKPPVLDVAAAQEYQQQLIMPGSSKSPTRTPQNIMLERRKGKERKIGHRRVNNEGEITFKRIHTSQIMGSIQLGIGHAVGSLASKPERDLLMQDFTIVETTNFVKDGSNITPAHHYSEFKFKSYAPVAFRYFRDLFGIPPDDFLVSLSNYPMVELTNPGASGSIFYLTEDDEFIIKTVSHTESEFLMKLLPGYYMNLNQNPRTLLPKFYGLYCYQCGGKNVRLVIMNNLLPSVIRLHEKYDLKGSTYKRKASKYERKKKYPTFKDLDFIEHHPDGIILEHEYTSLIKTITRDCRVLESFRIMDYSLLVGIHNLDEEKRLNLEQAKKIEDIKGKMSEESESAEQTSSGTTVNLVRSKSMNKQRLAAYSTAMESIQAETDFVADRNDVPPGGIPAKNAKGERLLIFLGIIDILQSFRLRKKLEHTFKSVIHDGDTVSVHRPAFYAQRFLNFMSKTVFKKSHSTLKHSPSKRKTSSIKKTSTTMGQDQGTSQNDQIPECIPDNKEDFKISSTVEEESSLKQSQKYTNYDEDVVKIKSASSNEASERVETNAISPSQVTFQLESDTYCASVKSSS